MKSTSHTHDSDPTSLVRLRTDGVLRASPGSSCDTVQNVIAEAVGNVPLSDHVVLDERRLRHTVYAARDGMKEITHLSKRCCCPTECYRTAGSRSFYSTQDRAATAFSRLGSCHVKLMERSEIVLGDGTGGATTVGTAIHSPHQHSRILSSCHVFLVAEQDEISLQKCVAHCSGFVAVEFKTWLFDFEASMLYAHREEMEHASAGGCLFHFAKAIHR